MSKSTFAPFLFAALTLLLTLPLACRKDKNEPPEEPLPDNPWGLPSATKTGENTFGCLLNGKPWVANIALGIFDPSARPLDIYYDETGTGRYYKLWNRHGKNKTPVAKELKPVFCHNDAVFKV